MSPRLSIFAVAVRPTRQAVFTAICALVIGGAGVAKGQWEEIHKLTAADAAEGDLFGTVGFGDGVIIVGARGDGDAGPVSGSAYLFDADTGEQLHKLTPEDGAQGDESSRSVAVSNGVAIIGSERDDDACPENPDCNSGSAYLFDVATGKQLHKLIADDGAEGDEFGWAVAIDGNIAVVGSRQCPGQCTGPGSAYLFDVATGKQICKLTVMDAALGDRFGSSVAISGNFVLIGAPGDDDGANGSGSAYILDATSGQQVRKLTAKDPEPGDGFGFDVAISGDTALVSAPFAGDQQTGAAYVVDVGTGDLLHELTAADGSPGDRFGLSVSMSSGTVLVGARHDDDAGANSGSAYLFDLTTGEQLQKLTASDAAEEDWFGASVAISGSSAVIGAGRDDDACPENPSCNSGSAYVFAIGDPCSSDLDYSGDVGSADLAALLAAWGLNPGHPADLDGDGNVGPVDLAILLGAWGACP